MSLVWLLLRTGRKPTRMNYPCQKAAATNVSIFFLPLLIPFLKKAYDLLGAIKVQKTIKVFLLLVVTGGSFVIVATYSWNYFQKVQYYKQLKTTGPFGKKVTGASIGVASTYVTIPHAMAAVSPHRVVSVHNSDATSWDFQCTGSGVCSDYYGSDAYVDQSVVNNMFTSGLKKLTGKATSQAAWESLLPSYHSNETVAIKVNFNDTIAGGGAFGYGDNDAYVDALAQVVNVAISGLKIRGVAEENIRVFDSSRHITDRFRALINYGNIKYYDRNGNGQDVESSTFDSNQATAHIDFSNSRYPAATSTHKIADVLIESDYLINIPIMKKHGGAGVTLSLKNHLGSINGFTAGGHSMHNYFYLGGSSYNSNVNPIVDINLNTHIKDKTILIIGDALYGGWRSNNTPPERWNSFGNDSPNMLFFGFDPVAIDSVMFDYLDREGWVASASEDILVVAASAGLGVHERWNNDIDKQYSTIDYIEVDYDKPQILPGSLITHIYNLLLL